MQNYITISRTYTEITPQSAEIGDFSDHGYISECEDVTFSELVKLMKMHYQPSYHPNDGGVMVSYSTGFEIDNYTTGTERNETIHYHHDNAPNVEKYWRLAAKFAGLIQ